jgi:hypothetical protein
MDLLDLLSPSLSQVALDSLNATAAEYNQTDGTARVCVRFCVSVISLFDL